MTPELWVTAGLGLLVAFARVATWRARRSPIGRVNHELAQRRARRQR